MNEAAIRERIEELNEIVTASPLIQPEPSAPQAARNTRRSTRKLATSECLDLLRLQLKYLLFDLEATRRENRYLREMLESRQRRDSEEGGENDPKWQTPPGQ